MQSTMMAAEPFKRADAGSYDDRASAYDRFQTLSAGPLVQRMLQLAQLTGQERILDVGAGTGVVALEAAGRVGPEGKVIGIDLSEGMLAVALRQGQQVVRIDIAMRWLHLSRRRFRDTGLPVPPGEALPLARAPVPRPQEV